MQAANNGRSRAMDAGTNALWAQMYSQMAGGTTKQRLSGVEQMQARRRRGAPRARAMAARCSSACTWPAPCVPGAPHATAAPRARPQEYARDKPMTREQLSALLDVSGQLLGDNNYKVALRAMQVWGCVAQNDGESVRPFIHNLLPFVVGGAGGVR